MFKHLSAILTILMLPAMLFGIIYVGMTVYSRTIEPAQAEPEQHMLSPKEPETTCGNGICEKTERTDMICAEDC